jgi:hypothetical protein
VSPSFFSLPAAAGGKNGELESPVAGVQSTQVLKYFSLITEIAIIANAKV